MARVSAVAAFPIAKLSSATGVCCNIPGVPAISFTAVVGVPAIVGFPLVLGLPDVVDFPAVAG